MTTNKPGASSGDDKPTSHEPTALSPVRNTDRLTVGQHMYRKIWECALSVVSILFMLWTPSLVPSATAWGVGWKIRMVNQCQHPAFSPSLNLAPHFSRFPEDSIAYKIFCYPKHFQSLYFPLTLLPPSLRRKTKGFIVNILSQKPLPFILQTVKGGETILLVIF